MKIPKKFVVGLIIIIGCSSQHGQIKARETLPSDSLTEKSCVPPYREASDEFYKSLNNILSHSKSISIIKNDKDDAEKKQTSSALPDNQKTAFLKPLKNINPNILYNQAFKLYQTRFYAQSRKAFNEFLKKYPAHSLSDNAQYWIGECYYAQEKYDRAFEAFESVLSHFKKSNKKSDSLLKLGLCCRQLCKSDHSPVYWKKVIQKYPRTNAAKLARKYLKRFKVR